MFSGMSRPPVARRLVIIELSPPPNIRIEFTTPPDSILHRRRVDAETLRADPTFARLETELYEATDRFFEHWLDADKPSPPDMPPTDPLEPA